MNRLKTLLFLALCATFLTNCDEDDELVLPPVTAGFSSSVLDDQGNVQFTNSSTGAATYYWDFGDGKNSTDENPTHQYGESGTYVVSLTSRTTVGNSNTTSGNVTVTVAVVVPPFDSGLLTNGDFEAGADSWIVGVGTDPAPVVTADGNTYYSSGDIASPDPGQPFLVNVSQKLALTDGTTYTLTFDAWSDRSRSIIAGLGRSGGDFANVNESVAITDTRTTYSVVLTVSGFGEADNRVLFDLNGEAGVVNIDNVKLVEGGDSGGGPFDSGLLTNGDFEAGADPWLVGVDDNTPAPVVTADGNTYYSSGDIASPDAGQPFLVNVSQKLALTDGTTYTLTFDAWSDRDRSIIAGLGRSEGDFANVNEAVAITDTRTTYSVVLTVSGFGEANNRVLFDLNGEAGVVNIDNVSLVEGGDSGGGEPFDSGLLTNGDFEAGADPWLVGVDDNSPAPVVTADGNTYYSSGDIASPDAGQPFLVNVSQKLALTDGTTYTLTFDAWSDRDRSIIAGLGRSEGDFANVNEAVAITDTKTTYSIELAVSGFGEANNRVLFDLNGEAGVVNIDNVSLTAND